MVVRLQAEREKEATRAIKHVKAMKYTQQTPVGFAREVQRQITR